MINSPAATLPTDLVASPPALRPRCVLAVGLFAAGVCQYDFLLLPSRDVQVPCVREATIQISER
jgi:hypothetical protein